MCTGHFGGLAMQSVAPHCYDKIVVSIGQYFRGTWSIFSVIVLSVLEGSLMLSGSNDQLDLDPDRMRCHCQTRQMVMYPSDSLVRFRLDRQTGQDKKILVSLVKTPVSGLSELSIQSLSGHFLADRLYPPPASSINQSLSMTHL